MKRIKKNKVTIKVLVELILLVVFIGLTVFLFVSGLKPKVESSIYYNEKGNTDYFVYLKQNDYFTENILPKGMQYIASLIDHINVKFDYSFDASNKFDYEYKYYVTAKLVATDRDDSTKLIYENEYILLDEMIEEAKDSSSFTISPVLSIDYNKYNDIMNAFKKDYALSMNSNLIVTLHIQVDGLYGSKKSQIHSEQIQQINIPLSEQTINVSFNANSIDNSNEIVNYSDSTTYRILYFVSAFASLVVAVINGLNIVNYFSSNTTKKSEYTKKINKIMKEYDRIIVNSQKVPDLSDLKIIDVTSFEEILDARETIQKPIIFVELSENKKAWFIIVGDKLAYRYQLTSNDIKNGE